MIDRENVIKGLETILDISNAKSCGQVLQMMWLTQSPC